MDHSAIATYTSLALFKQDLFERLETSEYLT